MRIRPCIDIHNGKVKQIVGSSLQGMAAKENFVAQQDASYYAALYREKELPGGHVILLNPVQDAEQYAADRLQALAALRAFPGGMQVGGGITPETAGDFLDSGASHIIVTSYVFRDGQVDLARLEALVKAAGREHLVLDLSCRRVGEEYRVVTDRWQKLTDVTVDADHLSWLSGYCDEFLIHAADVEGKRNGIERPLVRVLGQWLEKSGFPVTYAGGVHSLEDLDVIRELSDGRMDVTVGSALRLFGGDLDLDALVRHCGFYAAL